jgi:L-rhamnose mutarotase
MVVCSRSPRPQKDPALQAEYKKYHANVWPEMRSALKRTGWHNYSLFLHPDGSLFGMFESDKTLQECLVGMEKEEINAKWQAEMKKFVSARDRRRDELVLLLSDSPLSLAHTLSLHVNSLSFIACSRSQFPAAAELRPDETMVELEEVMHLP